MTAKPVQASLEIGEQTSDCLDAEDITNMRDLVEETESGETFLLVKEFGTALLAHIAAQAATAQRLRDLHTSSDGRFCDHCLADSGVDQPALVEHPCPTRRAIDGD